TKQYSVDSAKQYSVDSNHCYSDTTKNEFKFSEFSELKESKEFKLKDPLDLGGYFIIKGIEKVIMIQEQLSKNRPIIRNNELFISSITEERKSKTVMIKKGNNLFIKNNIFKTDVELFYILKYYNITDKEIFTICNTTLSMECLLKKDDEKENILTYLKGSNIDFIDRVLLPNIRKEKKG
ncbi:RNA polymerase III, second largest subunit, partial [Pseudoloma neurophilia]